MHTFAIKCFSYGKKVLPLLNSAFPLPTSWASRATSLKDLHDVEWGRDMLHTSRQRVLKHLKRQMNL